MSRSIDKYLRKAELHMKAGEAVQSENLYKKILSQFPKNKKAIQGLQKLRTPPQAELDKLIGLYNNNRMQSAVSLGNILAKKFPSALILYEILGAANMGLGITNESIKNYQKVLMLNPNHTDAYNNLGMNFYNQGNFLEAIEKYQKAVDIEPDFADAHYNLGNSLKETGNLAKAIESYRASLAINPNDVEVLSHFGDALRDYGEFEKAIECYEKILQLNPSLTDTKTKLHNVIQEKNDIEEIFSVYIKNSKKDSDPKNIHFIYGSILVSRNYPNAAIDCYKRALLVTPDCAEAHNHIGKIQETNGNLDEAIDSYTKALSIQPHFIEAIVNTGTTFQKKGCLDAAEEKYEQVINIKPDYAQAHSLLGSLLSEKNEHTRAFESLQRAVKLNPDSAITHYSLGNHYKKNLELNAAIKSYKKSIRLKADFFECFNNLGNSLKDIGKASEAIKNFDHALKFKPDYAVAHFNKSACLLKLTNFHLGWQEYEWRWKAVEKEDIAIWRRVANKPMWQPNGKQRVLLWREQGLGDEIMFASIIPQLYALCTKLIVVIDRRLISLFRRSFPNDIDFRGHDESFEDYEYDAHIPMGSLPLHLRQTIDSFKSTSGGWLYACEAKANRLRQKLLLDGSECLIGVSWNSSKPRKGAEKKLVSLSELAKNVYGHKVKLINLQYGDVDSEIECLRNESNIDVIQVPEIDIKNDIDGLASLIMACDKVVSISNVTVHLAGALGKQAQVLLAFSADWRWANDPHKVHWYDSVKLLRQTKVGDWDSVLEQL